MKAKELRILEMCIDNGIERGWNRAHKHIENPSPGVIKDDIALEVMNEIHEFFTFSELENQSEDL